jgi:hypothetical protein
LQLLYDLLDLKVPGVDLVVLAPRHDPLVACDTEVGEDAVLLVLVAGVGLETLAPVKELEGVIQRGGQDIQYFPFGENFTKLAGELSSSIGVSRHWPEAVSQI